MCELARVRELEDRIAKSRRSGLREFVKDGAHERGVVLLTSGLDSVGDHRMTHCRLTLLSSAVDMAVPPLVWGVWWFGFGQFAPASAGCGSRIVGLVTVSVSSSRWTSMKIAGMASSAIAPSAHSACWKPPVRAAGAALPACSSV